MKCMKRKDVFTTGQVAEICNVAPRTVTKWFDAGQLKGYRIPGSRDRRIPLVELMKFMKANNIPMESLDLGKLKILLVHSDTEYCDLIENEIKKNPKYQIQTAKNSFEAGVIAQRMIPNVILINLMSNEIDAAQICTSVRMCDDLQGSKIIAIANSLGDIEVQAVLNRGFDACLTDAYDISEMVSSIEQSTSLIY